MDEGRCNLVTYPEYSCRHCIILSTSKQCFSKSDHCFCDKQRACEEESLQSSLERRYEDILNKMSLQRIWFLRKGYLSQKKA